jgi:hypothetical protein
MLEPHSLPPCAALERVTNILKVSRVIFPKADAIVAVGEDSALNQDILLTSMGSFPHKEARL